MQVQTTRYAFPSLYIANRIQLYYAEPVYRLAEKEFKDFVDSFTEVLTEVDPHVPPLPPKDVIHRIYRDVSVSYVP